MRGFLGKGKKELRPFSLNKKAAFIYFPDSTLSKKALERADNFFEWDQGVRLLQGAVDDPDPDVDLLSDEDFTDSSAGA
ncbi:uncharacterized protein Z519_09260 [Cladophialophora bantiana CBS 173.52]|uniref:Uncharacterized protein n=1 Tax=Cladophialophora bantiana (strain ATCC 10958 / CBS 173.52 / CDC B-1940 / NIH 8579) TaxID=1442370 RepID=A0A0D2EID5_CLAB1|nr:uncharacterized protein Z519_09260 [Cladophialophora bantiana CBS 173.52]KIW89831.1 hypothetical protein Z519_09260 [Cladophialophora bantiana CBS 173.52]